MSDEPQIEVLERGQGPNVSSDIDLNEQLAAATEALKGIQATERLSGLGRFASKVQKFFQASLPSKFKSAPRLRAAAHLEPGQAPGRRRVHAHVVSNVGVEPGRGP